MRGKLSLPEVVENFYLERRDRGSGKLRIKVLGSEDLVPRLPSCRGKTLRGMGASQHHESEAKPS